jgi:putative peptidoglycan lipid II flippase
LDAAVTEAPDGAATSVTRSAAGMGAAAAVSRAFGGVRMVVIAAVLGTTYLGNAFQASNSVSNVLFELLAAGALSAVLVPTFVDAFGRRDQRRAEEVAGGLLSLAWIVLGVVAVLGIVAAPWLADILTTGIDDPTIAAQQQELTTYLLRFFVPQVLLYALGAVTTAVLHARGRFALTAIAPIGNTLVLVLSMLLFREMAGPNPGLALDQGEKLVLALGGTLGVAAFVAVPAIGLRRSGFRLRLGARRAYGDPEVRSVLGLSVWAALQHAGTGLLLAAALIAGGGVEGGVVAYQLAMVVFLAPYGIVAQPIHTAVLPRLASEVQRGDATSLRASVRWAADAMVVATVPIGALLTALSAPVMAVLAFGEAADAGGPELLGAALLGLAIGVPAYGGFLLLTRVAYALGNSRAPAVASIVVAALGAAGMLVAGATTDGSATLILIGVAHTASYALGAMALAWRLRREVGPAWHPSQLVPVALGAGVAVLAWLGMEAWDPDGRIATAVAAALLGAGGMAAYAAGLRLLGRVPPSSPVTVGVTAP